MGLDISAYSKLEEVEVPDFNTNSQESEWEDSMWDLGNIQIRSNYHFPEHTMGVDDGWYEPSGEYYSFRAGSYTGYNNWRDILTYGIGYGDKTDVVWEGDLKGPFTELLNFTDSDGIIGPTYSKKLYDDFVNYKSEIMDTLTKVVMGFSTDIKLDVDHYDYFFRVYDDFTKAFKLASDNGVVVFH